MTHTPTPEQAAIIEACAKTNDSLLIDALAGAAKTSTLVMAAHKMPLVPTLSVAFNKRIAEEMAKRMPSHIQCATMNSIGHRVWGSFVGKRLSVNSDKGYEILKDMQSRMVKGSPEWTDFNEQYGSLLRAFRFAKSAGWVPAMYAHLTRTGQGGITSDDEIYDVIANGIDYDPDDQFMGWLTEAINTSIAKAFEGSIDFDDQVYMSALFGGSFPKYPVVMVDEAQDLSPLNHAMIELMIAPGGRLIAVGDPNQAIYGFRGAHANSMEYLRERFNMKVLRLSCSFRCPIAVIQRAQMLRVPHMTWPEWAKQGEVKNLTEWSVSNVPEGSAIICRNNAPIFSAALTFIRAGRSVKLIGADIGTALVKLLRKMGDDSLPREDLESRIRAWEDDQLSKAKEGRKASIRDRAACLMVFAEQGKTLAEAIAFAECLFASNGTVQFLTGHKAKGLEWDVTYHLDPWRVPSKWAKKAAEAGDDSQMQQELNLRYVIETRAQSTLYLCNLDDLIAA